MGLTMADRLGVAVDRCASRGGVSLTCEKFDLLIKRAVALNHSPARLNSSKQSRAKGEYWFGKYPKGFTQA